MKLSDLFDFNALLSFVFPETCHICGNRLAGNQQYICTSCLMDLPRSLYHRTPDNLMEQRFIGQFKFVRATAHFLYSSGSPLSKVMQDLKYHHFKGLAEYMGKIIAQELYTTPFFNGIDIIVPIPMHFFKKAQRGYNQAEVIAKGISEVTGISTGNYLIAKKRHRTQTKQSVEMRKRNLKDIFRVKTSRDLNPLHILLVDDVCTTGSTITEAANTILSKFPDTRLSILTIGATH